MEKNELGALLRLVKGAYPDFIVNSDVIDAWEFILGKQDFQRSLDLLRSYMLTNPKFPPSPGAIYERKPASTYQDWEKESH